MLFSIELRWINTRCYEGARFIVHQGQGWIWRVIGADLYSYRSAASRLGYYREVHIA